MFVYVWPPSTLRQNQLEVTDEPPGAETMGFPLLSNAMIGSAPALIGSTIVGTPTANPFPAVTAL